MKYLPNLSSHCNDNTRSLYLFHLLVYSESHNSDVQTEIVILGETALGEELYCTMQSPLSEYWESKNMNSVTAP